MPNIEIRELDFVDWVVTTTDDRRLPIAHLFDGRGHETQDHRGAVLCIAGQQGEWITVRLGAYERQALQ